MRAARIAPFVLYLFAQASAAQVPVTNSCSPDAPVALQVATIKPGAEFASVTITNKGPKPVSAVLLRWKITASNGHTTPSVSTVDTATSGTLLASGQNVTTEANVEVGENTTLGALEVTCAAVLFNNKGFWGERDLPETTRLLGIRTGIKSERSRLLKIYESKGLEGLLRELKRPVAD